MDIRMNQRVKLFRKILDNITISDYHGLNSPGLTCYLNSVLQVLFMTQDFREPVERCCRNDPSTIDPHLKRLFADLKRRTAQTHRIIQQLEITDVHRQRDAAEYFEKILQFTSPEASKIFKGELNHQTTCLCCKKSSDSNSFFWILPLVVEASHHQTYSVTHGLELFFKTQHVSEDNWMFCNHCDEKREAEIKCEITHPPEVLTLLLKRFRFDYSQRRYVKLHCNVDVPQTLHIKSCRYELYAVVNHLGNLTGGHYTAEIRSFETGRWYHFNDDRVEMVRQTIFGDTSVTSSTAYLLMYRKDSEQGAEGDHKAQSARSDVEVEGRNDEQERRADVVDLHQLKHQKNNFKHLNGETLLEKHPDESHRNQQESSSSELIKQSDQKVTGQRSHKETLLQTNTKADGHMENPALLMQMSKSSRTQTDEGRQEPKGQKNNTNSGHMFHRDPAENVTEYQRAYCPRRYEENANVSWRRQEYMVSQTATETPHGSQSGSARNRDNGAESEAVKNMEDRRSGGNNITQRDGDVSVENSHVASCFYNGCSASLSPHQSRQSPSLGRKKNSPENGCPRSGKKENYVMTNNNNRQKFVSVHSSSYNMEATDRGKPLRTTNKNCEKRPAWRY